MEQRLFFVVKDQEIDLWRTSRALAEPTSCFELKAGWRPLKIRERRYDFRQPTSEMSDSLSKNPADGPLAELLVQLEPRIQAILGRYRIPRQDGEDLVQDSLVLLLRKASFLRNPTAYFLTTLQFRCRMYWRSRGRRRQEPMADETLENLAGAQAPTQEAALLRRDLDRLLGGLPPRQQSLIRLRYGLGYTAREVAERWGLEPDSVRQRSTHARGVFARHLSRHDLC